MLCCCGADVSRVKEDLLFLQGLNPVRCCSDDVTAAHCISRMKQGAAAGGNLPVNLQLTATVLFL